MSCPRKTVNCPLCGTQCKIVGKTTMHYEPLRKEELDEEKVLDIFPDYLHTVKLAMNNEPNIPNMQVIFKSEIPLIAKAIHSKFGKPNTEALEIDLLGHKHSLAVLRDNLGLDPKGESYQEDFCKMLGWV